MHRSPLVGQKSTEHALSTKTTSRTALSATAPPGREAALRTSSRPRHGKRSTRISPAPLLKLNNGVEMPALGLGVHQSHPEETVPAVETALQDGYRLIDTAYGNEKEVGEGIRRSDVDHDDIFVTTKLWLDDYGYDSALRAFDTSLANLGLDHLDVYLLHQPVPLEPEPWVAAYKAAEKLLADGRVRAIGVSNHTPGLLRTLRCRMLFRWSQRFRRLAPQAANVAPKCRSRPTSRPAVRGVFVGRSAVQLSWFCLLLRLSRV
ncbi:aldo/keto reductase [Streptomyces mirabilis]|uniref:aldo/keto reductase n=1 Tax=Streptomyces mirabilis TaxID=68239 RepID=UPI0036C2C19C